jgi:2-keto-4-pentenoate hydratase/2-oxohepta-3-ene-1,7-dioic acid hydratase in catechol pathway
MKIARFSINGQRRLGYLENDMLTDCGGDTLDSLVRSGFDLTKIGSRATPGLKYPVGDVRFERPIERPSKIICVGLNYADHTAESGFKQPDYPTLFGRFTSSLIAHQEALLRPSISSQFDYEGELAVILKSGGRRIKRPDALTHVAGYTVFNDGSVRDFQHRTTQWTVGKNFDATGAMGPYCVTPDELPAGASGLALTTRLNGQVVQAGNTRDLIFDVCSLIEIASESMTLEPLDIIVTGTPAGIGHSRKPPLYMKGGDLCEVEIEGLGTLKNPVRDESVTS